MNPNQTPEKIFQVLFLCTGNSARSIMAEALLSTLSKGRFQAWSGGSMPAGQVHPMALDLVKLTGYPLERLRSKSWDEFANPYAPVMDFVFTVCDKAAGEVCPIWPVQPVTAHWGFADPAAVTGSEEQRRRAFHQAFDQICNRVQLFISLPFDKLDRMALHAEVRKIGTSP